MCIIVYHGRYSQTVAMTVNVVHDFTQGIQKEREYCNHLTRCFNLKLVVKPQKTILFTHAVVVAGVGRLSALYVCVWIFCMCVYVCMSALKNKNHWTYHHQN